jgi:SAM-dependent methyltransferase
MVTRVREIMNTRMRVGMGDRTETYNERGATLLDRLRTRIVFASIRRNLPAGRDLCILDIGCGFHARHLVDLQDKLGHGTGIDFRVSEECVRNPKLSFVLESAESALAGLPEQCFDVVLFISVLEHLWEPLEALIHYHRVLKPGGALLLNVPTWLAKPVLEVSAFRLGTSPACEMDDHKMYYGKRDLWPLVVRAGFRPSLVRMKYENFGMTLFAKARRGP